MSLFSFLRKNKQETASDDGEFSSRAEIESQALRGRGKRKSSQSEEAADPVLPEKKRARRRLVGAIALVLAAVIGLPMLFDSEPKPLTDDISIQIPSKDKPASSIVQAPVAQAPVSASSSLSQSEQIVEPAIAKPTPESSVKTEAKAEKPVVAVKAESPEQKPAAAPEVKKPVKPETKAEAKTETKPALPKSDDGARAMALLEGKSDAAPAKSAADKKGKYAVQVAALATQEKINELRGKLNAAGIQSYTQKVATESGERTRIRVGPFASKEEAEKMRSKLIKMGLNGTVVPPSNP